MDGWAILHSSNISCFDRWTVCWNTILLKCPYPHSLYIEKVNMPFVFALISINLMKWEETVIWILKDSYSPRGLFKHPKLWPPFSWLWELADSHEISAWFLNRIKMYISTGIGKTTKVSYSYLVLLMRKQALEDHLMSEIANLEPRPVHSFPDFIFQMSAMKPKRASYCTDTDLVSSLFHQQGWAGLTQAMCAYVSASSKER